MGALLQRVRRDEGATALTVAIVLTVLVGVAAFAVDMGYLYAIRRQLQTAADAAALAGCRTLADEGTEAEIRAVVDEYAALNAVAPGDDLQVVDTRVTADAVQVTVAKDTGLFFARVLGRDAAHVEARAKARIAYLTGMRGLVPWSVPVIHANRVTVRVAGGAEVPLGEVGNGRYAGSVVVPTDAGTAGTLLTVTAYNSQTVYPDGSPNEYPNGVPETIEDAAAVWVRSATAPIQDVWLSKPVVTSGVDASVRLYVVAASEPEARFDHKGYKLKAFAGEPGRYYVDLDVPQTTATVEVYSVDVTVGKGNEKFTVTNAARLVVRRSTYPIADVQVSPAVITDGESRVVHVEVQLHDYVYGERYELKVVAGSEVGNFCALDLGTVKHPPNWRNPQDPSEFDVNTDPAYKPPTYYCYLAQELPFVVHLGDTIWTETGNLSGPSTERALDERFAGDTRTFAQWEALGRPASRRVVLVPVVEKMQVVTGQTPMRVVSLGAFYVEPDSDLQKDTIRGRFIEYVSPSDDISDEPPDGLYMMTVHLVTPD